MTFTKQSEDLESQILHYLNTGGSAIGLQAALTRLGTTVNDQVQTVHAQVITQDVTGDQTPDQIVELFYPNIFYDPTLNTSELFVFICKAGSYKSNELSFGYYEGLFPIQDMNGNGVPEIVFTQRQYDSEPSRNFIMQEWNGSEFIHLPSPSFLSIWGGDGLITDTDGNGTLELVVSGDYWTPHYGSGRSLHQVWAWDGIAFTLHRTYADPPLWRYEAVYEGDAASKIRNFAIARDAYQRALFDDSLLAWSANQDPLNPQPGLGDPAERARLTAYTRYRLLLLDVAQGYIDEARMGYEALQSEFPPGTVGHEYAEWASFFWQAYTANADNLTAACDKVMDESIFPYPRDIIEPLAAQATRDLPYSEVYDICPFHTIPIP